MRRERRRSVGRPGRRVRAELRRESVALLRKNAGLVSAVFAGYIVLGAVVVWGVAAWGRSHFAAFVAGLLVGGLGLLWNAFLVSQGIAQRLMGGDAEEWTAAELKKLDRRWRVFHDVPLQWGNVDHVVVGPGRIYAVETKWTSSRGGEQFLRPAAKQAARQADELSADLRDLGCGEEVLPLLVVWGGGVADSLGEKPKLWDDTRVVAGPHSSVWLDRMSGAASRRSSDVAVEEALEQLICSRRRG
jgi:hypothetical protein